ncbi:nicotinate-nucleotide--dimethylbenzimidazole phosphoribosyltransferase [Anaeromicropila herbilytica]|uniref:Nicotinate-nucleotide--dimethylbenzimidazole phosphoribosyltransferase n=1 Tax=Anaeromicropila herbilytica TaxID=2785025 RepID=A0A7R7EQM0_9FIRM|nr:nicotinate-nucleotide--dimethylbenzimidazole phosphoribosyltransferase [Anaeromicropila herbilytica]BCN32960.1 nicotinate-nucleotide--dimethylbenzimidazole phosphoribosyltransferase [Anaeromicropila herbilytica]
MPQNEFLNKIEPSDLSSKEVAKKRLDSIAKPLHSLGLLEDALIQIAGIQKTHKISINKKALVILCADNGVVEEKVTQTGSEVTAIVAANFLTSTSCACIMAKQSNTDIYPIDMGMLTDVYPKDTPLNQWKKIAYGTKNMAKYPAMTKEEAIQAIKAGIEIVRELKEMGYEIIATGEMGIGNTTTSSAITSVLLDVPVENVTGRGAGLSDDGLIRKQTVIKQAIALHKPNSNDPIDILSKIGGFDIAGLTGVFLGGAIYHIPIVMDGIISSVSALLAVRLSPDVKDYLLPSHVSKEPAAKMLLNALDVKPFLSCEMCLGEGTGAVALFPLLDMALSVYNEMSTFQDIELEEYKPL